MSEFEDDRIRNTIDMVTMAWPGQWAWWCDGHHVGGSANESSEADFMVQSHVVHASTVEPWEPCDLSTALIPERSGSIEMFYEPKFGCGCGIETHEDLLAHAVPSDEVMAYLRRDRDKDPVYVAKNRRRLITAMR